MPAAPQVTAPPRREQDLIVVPEATEPRRWGVVAAIVAGVVALAMIATLAVYAADQRDRAEELDAQLATAIDDQQALLDANAAARERAAALEVRVGTLEGDLQRAKQGKDVATASKQEAKQNLRQAQQALADEQARFRAYMGPPVADGSHVGRLFAVGADQSPARITTDLGRWFTGAAATQAAVDDGAISAGDSVARYFRNEGSTWRTVPLDTFATVTIRSSAGFTTTISAAELQRLMRADSRRAARITNDPFSITVVDGRVTALRQLRYP